jgi:hypothetical protein
MMNPKQLLIEFSADYEDEFDIEGFIVMTEDQWEAHKQMAKEHFDKKASAPLTDPSGRPDSYTNRSARETEVYFGTNESIIYEDLEDYMHSFNVTPLSQQSYDVLKELFNEHHEGYEWEHAGKKHVVPSRDVIRNGMLAMISSEEDED